jgi:hypothetical protein
VFVLDPTELDESEREEITTSRQASVKADVLYQLVQEFRQILL